MKMLFNHTKVIFVAIKIYNIYDISQKVALKVSEGTCIKQEY